MKKIPQKSITGDKTIDRMLALQYEVVLIFIYELFAAIACLILCTASQGYVS
jgi:hypothetical protein